MSSINLNITFPNEQLQLAYEFVQHTGKNIFLTGKAGTGKTTFLHTLRKATPKRFAVVAPTGVAAINAGGTTIHSFFQLPFGPIVTQKNLDGKNKSSFRGFRAEKIKLIRSLDLLVIDEISMVRSDMLDGIDEVLRRYRNRQLPFGGLQLLMIGDLHQLAPVVRQDEWAILKEHYETIYFFGSRALQQSPPVTIELKEIFRQNDEYFISMLNKVRRNQVDYQTLAELNERYNPGFVPLQDQDYITLTTHNSTAQNINQQKLKSISGKMREYTAEITGDFPEYSYPTDLCLSLKENAQVMFVKNDPSRDKLFYNGKIGRVTRIDNAGIYVKCKDDSSEIRVEKLEWQNIRYSLDENKTVREEPIGAFRQYPLKLAWAITIHKSQGLTFERVIIDANLSFAHGQVYVALSRCKTLEGIVLRSRIVESSIKTDDKISMYSEEIERNLPSAEYLFEEKRNYQGLVLNDLFYFTKLKGMFLFLRKIVADNFSSLVSSVHENTENLTSAFEKSISEVNEKFIIQLNELMESTLLPEENSALQERVKKASDYFYEKLNEIYLQAKNISVESDNKAVKKQVTELLTNLLSSMFEKLSCLKKSREGFSVIHHLQAKANAEIDGDKEKRPAKSYDYAGNGKVKDNLISILREWRNDVAKEKFTEQYMVLSQKAISEIAEQMPSTLKELSKIKGVGKVKLKQYGEDILELVSSYCEQNGIEPMLNPGLSGLPAEAKRRHGRHASQREGLEEAHGRVIKKQKPEKGMSQRTSLVLFKQGRTIEEIAMDRKFSVSTIEGHLSEFAGTGELDTFQLISEEKYELISGYIKSSGKTGLGDLKSGLGNKASFFEIKVVTKHLSRKKS